MIQAACGRAGTCSDLGLMVVISTNIKRYNRNSKACLHDPAYRANGEPCMPVCGMAQYLTITPHCLVMMTPVHSEASDFRIKLVLQLRNVM